MKILVIEDERNVAMMIHSLMTAEGYECLTAFDGISGFQTFETVQPDLIILDWNLPHGMSGIDVCTQIRHSPIADPYILMLTARTDDEDRLDGFSSGVDDYMVKPFHPKELAVRVRALLRRELRHIESPDGQRNGLETSLIETPHLRLCPESLLAETRPSIDVDFTPIPAKLSALEFKLLALLAQRPGRIWPREALLNALWKDRLKRSDRTVDTCVRQIRVKVPAPHATSFIKTQVGVGYFFEDAADE